MKELLIKTRDGNVSRETFYETLDFPWNKLKRYRLVTNRKNSAYVNTVNTFDIETTTIDNRGNGGKCFGYMYIWQMCIDGFCVFGRTWKQYREFIAKLSKHYMTTENKRLVIYVHNLSYEFQFIRNFFIWVDVFAKDKREVLKAVDSNGIEYRCSYYLSNMSLAQFCENTEKCIHIKQDGEAYNYKKIRTPLTDLDNNEFGYCFCDVKGLAECIEDRLKDDTLATIPMTSTGYIRRMCRVAMKTNPDNRKMFLRTRLTKEQLTLLNECKRGGNTAANRAIVGQVLENVRCKDAVSSYPFQMMTKYYPMSAFSRISKLDMKLFRYCLDNFCCMFRVKFDNIQIKPNVSVPYIPYSKLTKHSRDDIVFNGRLLKSDGCEMACTEIDWRIIESQYTWDRIGISDFHRAQRGDLPDELKDVIRQLFYDKTTLKHKDAYLYAKRKALLNAVFGMACTNPIHDIILLDDLEGWSVEKASVEEELEKYYRSKNSFLPVQWGVWVMAHGREWLQRAFDITGMNTAYGDTDSDKFQVVDEDAFNELNREAITLAEKYKAYADYEGERYYMGVFEDDGLYKKFRTWGAKKYAYIATNEKTGKDELHITVAGVNKKLGAAYLQKIGGIEKFDIGLIFPPGGGGGQEAHWNDEQIHTIKVNDVEIETASNVGLIDSTYTLGVTEEFMENMKFGFDFYATA